MSSFRLIPVLLGATVPLLAFAAADESFVTPGGGVQGGNCWTDMTSSWQVTPGSGITGNLGPNNGRVSISFSPFANWSESSHVVADVEVLGNQPAVIWFGVLGGAGSGIGCNVYLFPGRINKIGIPLVDARPTGLTNYPVPDASDYAQLPAAGNLNVGQVNMIRLENRSHYSTQLKIHSVKRLHDSVNFLAFVDRFGQQEAIDWPEKVNPTLDTIPVVDEGLTNSYRYGADQFGAVSNGISIAPSNNWKVQKVNGKWSFFAPSGKAFYSFGINEVGGISASPVVGREAWYGELPSQSGQFGEHYSTGRTKDGATVLQFNPYTHNLERKYGASWFDVSQVKAIQRMKNWGFNTLGANSLRELTMAQLMPSTFQQNIDGPHNKFPVGGLVGSMHDPFDPRFRTDIISSLQERLNLWCAHQYHLGIFIDNELPWGDVRSAYLTYAVPIAILKNTGTLHAKQRFVADLTRKYRTIGRFNQAWQTSFANWTALRNSSYTVPTNFNSNVRADMSNFLKSFANQYFRAIRDGLRSINYRGLYLGCRFASTTWAPEVVSVARQFVNVLSFNVYAPTLDDEILSLKNLDFPILISEFNFSAGDKGRIINNQVPTPSSEDQVGALQRYATNAATWNNVVGIHWYRWEDLPKTGRTYDNSNGSMGFLSITDQPYQNLVAGAQSSSDILMQTRRP